MIIYTGQPIDNYHGYIHYIQKGDIKNHLFYRGDVVKTVLLQLQLLKEEYDMEQRLEPMEQLSYLWMYNQPHKFSEMCDLVKGVMKIHDKFMNSDELLKAYEIESERLLIRSKISRNKEEGREEGRKEGQIELAILLIETKYHKSGEWLKQCTPQQMKHFHELFVQDMSYDDLKKNVLSY